VPSRTARPKGSEATQPRVAGGSTAYIRRMPAVARTHFAGSVSLKEFLEQAKPLSKHDQATIAKQALIVLEQNYAHLPLKRAMHAVDPVQRLKLLLREIEAAGPPLATAPLAFHHEMTEIFTSLRDLHTNYLLPAPFAGAVAFLPFMVEDCHVRGETVYVASHVVDGFDHPTFLPGVRILYWNAVPIERAVWNSAQRFAGSNRAARLARGVQTLTTRALAVALPPDEEWVLVRYKTQNGDEEELRFDWAVSPLPPVVSSDVDTGVRAASVIGVDLEQQLVQRARTLLFASHVTEDTKEVRRKVARGTRLDALESALPAVLTAKRITTSSGDFGYVRIRSFDVDPKPFVNEFLRLISALPERGLIIDVRGNGGGVIHAGEYLLQLLTPKRIEPEPAQFINSPLNLALCEANGVDSQWADLTPWTESMRESLRTGSAFSAGFPISDPVLCNAIGQRYFGPVVLITDALCYSTTDIFAAGFQDHGIGIILGVDRNTGAGGANVWQQQHLRDLVLTGPESVYAQLPDGAGLRVSMRRTLRVGERAGMPVEDLGVIPDEYHPLTRRDVLEDNADLKDRAGAILTSMKSRSLRVRCTAAGRDEVTLQLRARGMDRIDVYVGTRPIASVDDGLRQRDVVVHRKGGTGDVVELLGYADELLVARFRIPWDELVSSSPTPGMSARSRSSRKSAQRIPRTKNPGDDAVAARDAQAFGGAALV
jgi:hypothetical protein